MASVGQHNSLLWPSALLAGADIPYDTLRQHWLTQATHVSSRACLDCALNLVVFTVLQDSLLFVLLHSNMAPLKVAERKKLTTIKGNLQQNREMSEVICTKCLQGKSILFLYLRLVDKSLFPCQAEQMFSEIRDFVYNHVDQVKWMDKQSHQEAKQKVC